MAIAGTKIPNGPIQETIEHLDRLDDQLRKLARRLGAVFTKIVPTESGLHVTLRNPTTEKSRSVLLSGELPKIIEVLREVVIGLATLPPPRIAGAEAPKKIPPKIDRSQPLTLDDIPYAFATIAKGYRVAFEGPPKWVDEDPNDQIVRIRSEINPDINAEYRFDIRRVDSHAVIDGFRLCARSVSETAKEGDKPARKPYKPFVPDRDVPSAFHEAAAQAGVEMVNPVRTEHEEGKVTLRPIAISVEVNGQTHRFQGDQICRGKDFVFKGRSVVDASATEIKRFRDEADRTVNLITQQIRDSLSLEASASFIGKTAYGEEGRLPVETRAALKPGDRRVNVEGGILSLSAIHHLDGSPESFEQFHAALEALRQIGEQHHQLAAREIAAERSGAPDQPSCNEELPTLFRDAAETIGVTLGIVTHKRDGSLHKMDVSEADGIIVTIGIGPDQKTFECDGGRITRSFTFDDKRNEGELPRFEKFAATLVRDAKAAREESARWMVDHRQGSYSMRTIPTPPDLIQPLPGGAVKVSALAAG